MSLQTEAPFPRKQASALWLAIVTPDDRTLDVQPALIEAIKGQVTRYQGYIDHTSGNTIVALFGAPHSDEAHIAKAVHAALSIQQLLAHWNGARTRPQNQTISCRIGIASGGVERQAESERTGGVALLTAQRLSQMAMPAETWADAATQSGTAQEFEWTDVGSVRLFSDSQRVDVYALVAKRAPANRFESSAGRRLSPFVGRTEELRSLMALWDAAQAGAGQIVSVIGNAGLGKSRLTHEFKNRLGALSIRQLEGSCFAYGDTVPYMPFREILRSLFAIAQSDDDSAARSKVDQCLNILGTPPQARPYIHRLLDIGLTAESLPGHLVRARTIEALRDLFSALARREPFALIIEDVHWIDKSTEEALASLIDAISQIPILLLIVYRPEYLHAWKQRANYSEIVLGGLTSAHATNIVHSILHHPRAKTLQLLPLSKQDGATLAAEVLGVAEIPKEIQEHIAGVAQGNPFFIEELTLSLLAKGVLRKVGRAVVLTTRIAALEIPPTVQGIFLSRVDHLPEPARLVIQYAAAIGRVFAFDVLQRVVDTHEGLYDILQDLEDQEFIYAIESEATVEHSFRHVLAQQAVYESIPAKTKEAIHARIAQALLSIHAGREGDVCEMLAYHYLRAQMEQAALHYVDMANRKAISEASVHEAQKQYDTAMGLLDRLPDDQANQRIRIALLARQGVVLEAFGRMRDWYRDLDRFRKTAEALNDDGLLGALYGKLAWLAWYFGDNDRGIEIGARAAPLCERAGNHEDAAQAYLAWEVSHLARGDLVQASELKREVHRMTALQFNVNWHARAARVAVMASIYRGHWQQALADAEEDMAVSDRYADHNEFAHAAMWAAQVYVETGDYENASRLGELAVARSLWPDKRWHQGGLVRAWSHTGRAEAAVEVSLHCCAAFRQLGAIPFSEWWAGWLAESYLLAGRFPEARRTLEEHLAICVRHGKQYLAGVALRRLAEVDLAEHERSGACPHLDQAEQLLSGARAENELAIVASLRARLHLATGDPGAAAAKAHFALAEFERLGTAHRAREVRTFLASVR